MQEALYVETFTLSYLAHAPFNLAENISRARRRAADAAYSLREAQLWHQAATIVTGAVVVGLVGAATLGGATLAGLGPLAALTAGAVFFATNAKVAAAEKARTYESRRRSLGAGWSWEFRALHDIGEFEVIFHDRENHPFILYYDARGNIVGRTFGTKKVFLEFYNPIPKPNLETTRAIYERVCMQIFLNPFEDKNDGPYVPRLAPPTRLQNAASSLSSGTPPELPKFAPRRLYEDSVPLRRRESRWRVRRRVGASRAIPLAAE